MKKTSLIPTSDTREAGWNSSQPSLNVAAHADYEPASFMTTRKAALSRLLFSQPVIAREPLSTNELVIR